MKTSRPNIIYILADDLGYADLGCTGARDASGAAIDVSPNLDRLAREGIRFTRGYSNSPVCSPTRLALITGRWQYRLRAGAEEPLTPAKGDKVFGLPSSHPTLPSLLRDAGYRTALVGKWHLGYPPQFGPRLSGYESFYGFHAGGSEYFTHCDSRGKPDLWQNEEPVSEDGYLTDLLSRRAVDFIDSQPAQQPFFLSLHYSAPHWPWLSRDDHAESARIDNRLKHVDGGSLATYQKMIHHMDEGIGWVMAALERRGIADNTIVVFTSDNGGERYSNNWPFVGQKMDLLEGGIRVPLITRWPVRFAAGQVSALPSLTMDWTATLLDAAGVTADPGHPLDGVSLLDSLDRGQDSNEVRCLCWRMHHRDQRAVVQGRWKYLRVEGVDYLFDVDADPRERANLAQREPGRLSHLQSIWQEWDRQLPPIPEDAGVSLVFDTGDLPTATF